MAVAMYEDVSATQTAVAAVELSVCIANWNCRELLRRCLSSLLNQPQGVRFEIIVVDNGSTDGAAAMVAHEFPHVRLIRNGNNRGFSTASNQAAAVARGNLLLFLNNDTLVPPYTLRQFARFFEQYPDTAMIGPRLVGADGRYQISYRRKPSLGALLHRIGLLRWTGLFRRAYYDYRRSDYQPHGVREVEILMGAAVVLTRDVFERGGRWDEAFRFGVEDIDLSTQVSSLGPVLYFGEAEITHFGREASRANVRFSAPNVVIGYVRYFRKSGVSPWALFAYKLMLTLDAPIQLFGKMIQTALRSLRRKPEKAARSRRAAAGIGHFLWNDLGRFWKA
ncbi:hypothetical protein BH11PLA2_BH11PLA2_13230 [soil metagenome]